MGNVSLLSLKILFITCFLIVANASGATLTVTKTDDTSDGACDADCSLREAIATAESNDTIEFASPLFDSPQIITLSGAEGFQQLLVLKNLVINGKGAKLLTVRRRNSGSPAFRVFAVGGTANVVLQGVTITGGSDSGGGGGVLNDNSATLTINNCHITGNVAQLNGGGIRNVSGTLNVNNTTVSGNIAGIFNGGGIASTGGTVNITNSTISGNYSNNGQVGAGGIWASGGAMNITNSTITNNSSIGIQQNTPAIVTVRNSIVAGNQVFITNPDLVGAFVSNGYNLVGYVGAATGFNQTGDQVGTSSAILDAGLSKLGDFGGATPTHALYRNSPALNAADQSNILTFDQRGIRRRIDGRADIGAFENNFAFSNNPTGAGSGGTLPDGSRGTPYNVQFSAVRLFAPPPPSRPSSNFVPLVFSIFAGNLPSGLTLDAGSGILFGTPDESGTFNFTLKVTDAADGSAGAQAYTLVILAPNAASVRIGGRVFTPDGRSLRNARVTLINSNGAGRTVITSTFGYYRFDGVAAGQTVIVTVTSKLYSFEPQIVSVSEDLEDLNFSAMPGSAGKNEQIMKSVID